MEDGKTVEPWYNEIAVVKGEHYESYIKSI